MKSRLNDQILILFRQLVKFCKFWISCSKLLPSQDGEAVAEFKHGSEITNTRWMRSWTIGFKRQYSAVSIISSWSWMTIPVLALFNIFLSPLDRGMECTLRKHTGQTNRVSMWEATAFLRGVGEAIVSSFASSRREVRSKKWCELSRGLPRWLGLEPLPAKWGWENWACPAWKRAGFRGHLTAWQGPWKTTAEMGPFRGAQWRDKRQQTQVSAREILVGWMDGKQFHCEDS